MDADVIGWGVTIEELNYIYWALESKVHELDRFCEKLYQMQSDPLTLKHTIGMRNELARLMREVSEKLNFPF